MARARQFSCFVVLVGRLQGADAFDPTYAFIAQNKDELTLPLVMEPLPTPKVRALWLWRGSL